MNRNRFIKTSLIAGIGSQFQLNSELINLFMTNEINIENLLGLSTSHLKSEVFLLEDKTFDAFLEMKSAASKDDIEIKIVSGYRSFQDQKSIWERKFRLLSKSKTPTEAISEIITYSSIPGTSRHHWGTDIDIIDASVPAPKGDILLEKYYHDDAPFAKLKSWMDKYSRDFGFELVYTNTSDRAGFSYEPWHYSYAPQSISFLKLQSNEDYQKAWRNLSFDGKSDMTELFIDLYFKNYSLGINPNLMPS